ncbi:hypothetical protein APHWI1_0710 [Anaplasma phagocytophilum str. ApWI1]|uniref:Uncharacterized protein n=1 Tax=Anaplasma phagocytophilum str. ApWI1 TaxID=1359155 RepID=A0A0F3Q0G7_ANAPH|nr:hypothetical protein APHWI1_0710 [Anaplasma phagocytophilum str. ApWI1]
MNICGTVFLPERSTISSCAAGSLVISISLKGILFLLNKALALVQYGQGTLVYMTTSRISPPLSIHLYALG